MKINIIPVGYPFQIRPVFTIEPHPGPLQKERESQCPRSRVVHYIIFDAKN